MELKADTYYRTRDGSKAYVGYHSHDTNDAALWRGEYLHRFRQEDTWISCDWDDSGSCYGPDFIADVDLISEWSEEDGL